MPPLPASPLQQAREARVKVMRWQRGGSAMRYALRREQSLSDCDAERAQRRVMRA